MKCSDIKATRVSISQSVTDAGERPIESQPWEAKEKQEA